MVYKNPKKVAEDLERRAKNLAERVYQKERYSHLPVSELNEWHKKSFDRYRQAGAMYIRAKKPKKAIEMYQGAIRYAPSEQIEERVKEKIRKLSWTGKRLERGLFSAASIISLLGALFFTFLNLSGYATGSLAKDTSLIGIVLFILGLVFAFVFFKRNKR